MMETLFGAWVVFGLVVDAVQWACARSRLGVNFRELAASGQVLAAAAVPELSP